MNSSPGQLQDTLSRNFQELSPQLQQAARYVLDNPQDVATHSLRKIAERSGLTPPTFSRLARAVGFDEYELLKDVCRAELKQNSMTLAQRAQIMQGDSDLTSETRGSFAHRHISSTMDNLSLLSQRLDPEQLADTADHLAASKKVILVGGLSSRAVLEYLHHMMGLAKPGWMLINDNHASTSALL